MPVAGVTSNPPRRKHHMGPRPRRRLLYSFVCCFHLLLKCGDRIMIFFHNFHLVRQITEVAHCTQSWTAFLHRCRLLRHHFCYTIRPILCGKPFATKSPISYGSTTLTTVGLLGLLLMSQSASHTCAYTNILCTVMDVVHHAQTSRRVVEAVCSWGKETVALNPIDVKNVFYVFLFRARFLTFFIFPTFFIFKNVHLKHHLKSLSKQRKQIGSV